MHSDGSGSDLLTIEGGGSRHPATETTIVDGKHYIQMDGKEVFRFATRVMASATQEVLACAGLKLDDVQWIIPHQANIRIIEAAARGLKLPMDRFIVNLERYGNTSTASIPMAMVEALEKVRSGRTKIVMVGFGAVLRGRCRRMDQTIEQGHVTRSNTAALQNYARWSAALCVLSRVCCTAANYSVVNRL
jgi:3-oxoacyl-[acyl-carrier-protein] synthase-3